MAHYEEQKSGWGGPALLLGLAAVIAVSVIMIAGSGSRVVDPSRISEPAASSAPVEKQEDRVLESTPTQPAAPIAQ